MKHIKLFEDFDDIQWEEEEVNNDTQREFTRPSPYSRGFVIDYKGVKQRQEDVVFCREEGVYCLRKDAKWFDLPLGSYMTPEGIFIGNWSK